MESSAPVEGATAAPENQAESVGPSPGADTVQAPLEMPKPASSSSRKPSVGDAPVLDVKGVEHQARDSPDEDESSRPRKRTRRDASSEVQASDDNLDEGEIGSPESEADDSEAEGEDSAGKAVPGALQPAQPAKASLGWNEGISGGLRTSFGVSAVIALEAAAPQPKEEPQVTEEKTEPEVDQQKTRTAELLRQEVTDEEREAVKRALGEAQMEVARFQDKKATWLLPSFRADSLVGQNWAHACDSMWKDWVLSFFIENQTAASEVGIDTEFFKRACQARLKALKKHAPGGVPRTLDLALRRRLKRVVKGSTLRAILATFQVTQKAATGEIPLPEPQTTQTSSKPTSEDEMDDKVDVEMVDSEPAVNQNAPAIELDLLHRYYPGIPDDAEFCLTCASHGHRSNACPSRTCRFCQGIHFSHRCPTRKRCTKCKQLGHTVATCREKLALAPGEGLVECAFCQGQDHVEDVCPELWQSGRADPEHTKKVKKLPVFCYCCGAEGHYGGDCGLADGSRFLPSQTWTSASLPLYQDPQSVEEALAYQYETPVPSSLHSIPGRSIKPQSHVVFEDSDDDENPEKTFLQHVSSRGSRGSEPARNTRSAHMQMNITTNANLGAPNSQLQQLQNQSQKNSNNNNNNNNNPASLPKRPRKKARGAHNSQVPSRAHVSRGAPAPPNLRRGRGGSALGGHPVQQPPPGTPSGPSSQNQRGGGGGGRGRGGFSNLGGRGRKGRGARML